jgi:hypothetical protein
MDLTITRDDFGRLICTARVDGHDAVVAASDAAVAGAELLEALEDARKLGFGECFWLTEAGDYRWMFRREGDRVTVVAVRSSGTITGWQHVIHTETAFEPFAQHLTSELAKACSGM